MRCQALVAASLLPDSALRPTDASTVASALTCLERAITLHHGCRRRVLVGDALLARVFRHMGTVDVQTMEVVAAAAEGMVDTASETERVTIGGLERSGASRAAWSAALQRCAVPPASPYAEAVRLQRAVAPCEADALAPDRAVRDTMMALLRQR